MSLFEKASRAKLRFSSVRGLISYEDLWDIPLTSKNGFDLDSVAKEANAQLKESSEESFVVTKTNPARETAELRLDIVKHVIAVRLQEGDERAARAKRQDEKKRLLEILDKKQDDKLRAMSDEDIRARIAEIDRD